MKKRTRVPAWVKAEKQFAKAEEERGMRELVQRSAALRAEASDKQAFEAWRQDEEDLDALLSRDAGEESPQPCLPELDHLFSEPSAVEIEITPMILETNLINQLQALKAKLEALGCTVKIIAPNGAEVL